jgi:hypothetical protein
VTDNVDQTTTASCLPASGSTFPIGSTKVLCDATDSSGNAAVETSFLVTVTANTTSPVISNTAVTITASTAMVSWITDESSSSKVFYSTTTPVDVSSTSATPVVMDGSMVLNHSLDISGLTPNTTYYFVVESTDGSDNTTVASESTFTTTSS